MKKVFALLLVSVCLLSSFAAADGYFSTANPGPYVFVYPDGFEKQEDMDDGWTHYVNAANGDKIRYKLEEADAFLSVALSAYKSKPELAFEFIEKMYWDKDEYGLIQGEYSIAGGCYKFNARPGTADKNVYTTLAVCESYIMTIQVESEDSHRRLDLSLGIENSLNVVEWPDPLRFMGAPWRK